MSLKYRIAATIFALEIALIGSVLWITLGHSMSSIHEQIASTEAVTLQLLGDLSRSALLTDEFADLQTFIEGTKRDPRVQSVIIGDVRGRVVAATDAQPDRVALSRAWRSRAWLLAPRRRSRSRQHARHPRDRVLELSAGARLSRYPQPRHQHRDHRHGCDRRGRARHGLLLDPSAGEAGCRGGSGRRRQPRAQGGGAGARRGRPGRPGLQQHGRPACGQSRRVAGRARPLGPADRGDVRGLRALGRRRPAGRCTTASFRGFSVSWASGIALGDAFRGSQPDCPSASAGGRCRLAGLEDLARRSASTIAARRADRGRCICGMAAGSAVSEFGTQDGGMVEIYSDVTEGKRRQQALEQGEQRLRAIMDSVIDGIVTVADEGTVEFRQPRRGADLRLRAGRAGRPRHRRAGGRDRAARGRASAWPVRGRPCGLAPAPPARDGRPAPERAPASRSSSRSPSSICTAVGPSS